MDWRGLEQFWCVLWKPAVVFELVPLLGTDLQTKREGGGSQAGWVCTRPITTLLVYYSFAELQRFPELYFLHATKKQ